MSMFEKYQTNGQPPQLTEPETEHPKEQQSEQTATPPQHRAQLKGVLARIAEWGAGMDIVDFENAITERARAGQPGGELFETLTIHWRRRC